MPRGRETDILIKKIFLLRGTEGKESYTFKKTRMSGKDIKKGLTGLQGGGETHHRRLCFGKKIYQERKGGRRKKKEKAEDFTEISFEKATIRRK